jgi:hypothetical protein
MTWLWLSSSLLVRFPRGAHMTCVYATTIYGDECDVAVVACREFRESVSDTPQQHAATGAQSWQSVSVIPAVAYSSWHGH